MSCQHLSPARVPLPTRFSLVAGCLMALFGCAAATAQLTPNPKVTTVAGGFINNGKLATSSGLEQPTDIASDSKGNLYIADGFDHRIRKFTKTTGILSTFAGTGISGFNGDGLAPSKTLISFPQGIVVDSHGNVIFCDTGNNRIRMISPSKVVTTIAGTGVAGFGGDGGPATAALLSAPATLSLDSAGNLYFSDVGNQRVREVDAAGNIHTLAGNGTAGFSGDNGPATSASLHNPQYAVVDGTGNLYIADNFNGRVRRVDPNGTITTFAGTGSGGCAGDGQPATSAMVGMGSPGGLLIFQGKLYITTFACSRIRAVDLATGIISTFAGSTAGFDGNGHAALSSQFRFPTVWAAGLLVDNTASNMFVADGSNEQIRAISLATNAVTDLAGGYIGDGLKPTKANLNLPDSLVFDLHGNLYIEDAQDNRVRAMTPAGPTSTISTFAGTGISGFNGDSIPASSAQLYLPRGIAIDPNDNIYIADTGNFRVRKVGTTGNITTLAQNANFKILTGMTVDSAGNVYVADPPSCVVWQITPGGSASVFAGILNSCGYNGDGIAATAAKLAFPWRVALDGAGNLYITDVFNNRVRKVSGGMISTVAGTGACGFSGDGGAATLAMICGPTGIAIDSKGNVYFSDASNRRVRRISAGNISTIAGTGTPGYNGTGLAALSTNLDGLDGLVVTSKGVFVADTAQNRVRKIH